jgi:NAD(P)-dependent dehydrogenase (short-subunit alcohol dehydrogenase family)
MVEGSVKNIRGKTALVTGAGNGIGLSLAKALAEAGAKVVAADINPLNLASAVRDIGSVGEVQGVNLDVRLQDSWRNAADLAEDRFGKIHIFCSNAGIAGGGGLVEERSVEDLDAVWQINVRGMFLGVGEILPRIKRHGEEGHIVITSSVMGLFCMPRTSIYAMTKYAALALAETLFMELRDSPIGVSVLCPGAVNTALLTSVRDNLPSQRGSAANADTTNLLAAGMDAGAVGRHVRDAILEDRFYVLTHPEYRPLIADRVGVLLDAFGESAAPGHADNLSIYRTYSGAPVGARI